jgi:membrane dipeptidase
MANDDPTDTTPNTHIDAVRALLKRVPLVDGHNDTAWQIDRRFANQLAAFDFEATDGLVPPMHTDLRRLRAGGVGAQFWAVYLTADVAGPRAVRALLEQIDVVHRLIEAYPTHLELALTADDVERIHGAGRIASLIGIESGHAIDTSLAVLRQSYALGARYMTLTHSLNTRWADAATDEPKHGGLTGFGRAVVGEMNRLGILVDLSHTSSRTTHQVLDVTRAPVVFTHSSARALTDHPRNVPDDVLQRVTSNGGMVMVTFVPAFVSEASRGWHAAEAGEKARLAELHPESLADVANALARWRAEHPRPRATLGDVADHIDHVRRVAGADHVGLGGDFDGIDNGPLGLEDVSRYPDLLAELARRGWTTDDLEKLAGRNLLRVLRAAEQTALTLRAKTGASEARLERTIERGTEPPTTKHG